MEIYLILMGLIFWGCVYGDCSGKEKSNLRNEVKKLRYAHRADDYLAAFKFADDVEAYYVDENGRPQENQRGSDGSFSSAGSEMVCLYEFSPQYSPELGRIQH